MDKDNYTLTENDIAALVNASKKLEFGSTEVGTLEKRIIKNGGTTQVVAKFRKATDEVKTAEILYFPFTASIEGKEVVRGKLNLEAVKNKKFNPVKKIINKMISSLNNLSRLEYRLNYYVDDLGRTYEIVDGIKVYYDDRGFDYYIKCDQDGNEISWLKLDDNSVGEFLDMDRTVIRVHGRIYPMSEKGDILYDNEIPFLGPRR